MADGTDWLERELRQHARALNACRCRWPLLGPSYHPLAGALFWADEAPPWSRSRAAEDVLRCLWHYRTGLLLGERRDFAGLWELGLRLFPHWVGFHPSRRAPSRRYAVLYRAGRRAAARCVLAMVEGTDEPA